MSLKNQLIFSADSLSGTEGPAEATKVALRVTPFDNFIYLSTARTLFKFEAFRRDAYPHSIPPIAMQYAFAQDMLRLPEVKKLDQEDRFLSRWLMDSNYRHGVQTARENAKANRKPYEKAFHEEITQGFLRLQEWGEISMVFTSRLLQDIQEIMEDGTRKSCEELLILRARVKTQMDLEENGRFSYRHGSQWDLNPDLKEAYPQFVKWLWFGRLGFHFED